VPNLDDRGGDMQALRKQFHDWPLPDVDEVIVVRGGAVSHLVP
jgi:hypothetical protein